MSRRPGQAFDPPFPPATGAEPCATDPEGWYAVGDPEQDEAAKTWCRACPLVRECLAWALAHERDGVWGATTPDERDALRSAHRIRLVPVTGLIRNTTTAPTPNPPALAGVTTSSTRSTDRDVSED